MSNQEPHGYDGGKGTSTANLELIRNTHGWTVYELSKFSFLNTEACKVKINGSNPIPLDAEQGVTMNENDAPIRSFVIVESGINYKWFGRY